ncbi:MAG: transketolase family protein [Flavobacteriaceae bacterium]
MKEYTFTEKIDTRSGFGVGLAEIGDLNENVVALCADLTGSLKMNAFKDAHPERFFQIGIAEANMMGIAAGMTIGGKIPFTGTFANFSTGRVYDQIRQSIAYSHKNVKICASHAGITLGEDGATHQILEDLGLMKMLPGMTVINTCDFEQTRKATHAIAAHNGPVYLRFGRPAVPNFTSDLPFEIGKGILLQEGTDVTLVATGHLVWEALEAAKSLHKQGVSAEVINIHTIKPLDDALILQSAKKTGAVVSCEEHNYLGGLGESVARVLAEQHPPPPQAFVATQDTFGESGTPAQLMEKYGLNAAAIAKKAKEVLAKKA